MFSWVEASSAYHALVEKIANDMELGDSLPVGEAGDLSSTRPGKRGTSPEVRPGSFGVEVRHGRGDFREIAYTGSPEGPRGWSFRASEIVLRVLCTADVKVYPRG